MKNKIQEVQNYFINKITACDFEVTKFEISTNEWVYVDALIDNEFKFRIGLSSKYNSHYISSFDSFMSIKIPEDRLKNIHDLVESKMEKAKMEKIENLKAELEKLQTA